MSERCDQTSEWPSISDPIHNCSEPQYLDASTTGTAATTRRLARRSATLFAFLRRRLFLVVVIIIVIVVVLLLLALALGRLFLFWENC